MRGTVRHGRETAEFGRLANLSDAVFAIAMTLLVLTLDVPDPAAGPLADALLERLPQLIAFVLAFALVASVWWAHHKFVSRLASIGRSEMALTLILLGAVALMPYPTGLIGIAPTDSAAAVPFIGLFVIIMAIFLLLYVSAQRTHAWREAVPPDLFRWLLIYWAASIGGMLTALVVAIWLPLVGLALAAATGSVVAMAMEWRAPAAYKKWSP